jgi:AraC-like DNA-binding protein
MQMCEVNEKGTVLRKWNLHPGAVFIWPQRLQRRVIFEEASEWYSVGIDAFLFGRVNLWDNFNPPCEISLDERQAALMHTCMVYLHALQYGADAAPQEIDPRLLPVEKQPRPQALTSMENLQAQSLAQVIFSLCWSVHDAKFSFPDALPDWLANVLQLSESKPQLKVRDLAQKVGFSESQFRRLFVQWVGMPPHEYLHQHRLQHAQHLLETTDITCAEISRQLGFNSLSHFTQTFKSTFGATPARHRQLFLQSMQGDR